MLVELDAEAGDGVLLFTDEEDVYDPCPTEGVLPDGTPCIIGPLSVHEADWNAAVSALYVSGYELGNEGEPIGERDGWTAYAVVLLP